MDIIEKNNFKKASTTSTILIIILIASSVYYFLPKNFFSSSSSKSFGNFKSRLGSGKDATKVHQDLKWKKQFGKKTKEKTKESYFSYISKKNKEKNK